MKEIQRRAGFEEYQQASKIGFKAGGGKKLSAIRREMEEHHHMAQFKDIVRELLSFPEGHFKIDKRAITNILDSMTVSTGYDRLQNNIVRQLQQRLSRNPIYISN